MDLLYPANILLNSVPYANHPAAFLRSFLAWLMEKITGDRIFVQMLRSACVKPMEKYMKLCQERNNEYNKMVYDQGLIRGRRIYISSGLGQVRTRLYNRACSGDAPNSSWVTDYSLLRLCSADQIRGRGSENFIALAAATVLFNVA